MEFFVPNIRNKKKISALTTSIQHCTGGSYQCNKKKKKKEIKSIRNGKKDIKLSLFREDTSVNVENLMEPMN